MTSKTMTDGSLLKKAVSNIDIPAHETRIFKSGILPNKLKYVVIQDTVDDISHVSMAVKVGSLDEPIEYLGLAHFLEHMLFMGSKKYTNESHFEEILKTHGGSCNAYTGAYETVYLFNVLNSSSQKDINILTTILDIFSRFFIDPLFDESSVQREINAVNSEHLKNLNNDFWFTRQVIYNLSNENSGLHFSTGTLKTLGSIDLSKLRMEMIKLYNSYYSSDNMCITIQTHLDVKIIEQIIIDIFSLVPNRKLEDNFTVNIGKFKMRNSEYHMIPSNDINEIIYFWDIPTFYTYLNNAAVGVVSNIFDYNGVGNLTYILKRLGLATNVSGYYLSEGIYLLTISMCKCNVLTTNITSINNVVKYYLNVFIQELNWDDIYKYMINKYQLKYIYDTKISNSELVDQISINLHYYNAFDVYKGESIIIKPDMDVLINLVKLLKFDNANIIYFTQTKIDKNSYLNFTKDKYYLKKYGKISKTFIPEKSIKYIFSIDLDNKYLSIKPNIINNLDKYNIPSRVNGVWYGASSKFNEPYVYGLIYLSNICMVNKISSYILTLLACSILNQYIAEIYCQQFEIGYSVSYNVCNITGIISLSIVGFNFGYTDFYYKVLDVIKQIKIEDIIIKLTINIFTENLKNIDTMSPWEYINYINSIYKYKYRYKNSDLLVALDKLSNDANKPLIGRITKRLRQIAAMKVFAISSIIYGNINKEDIPIISSPIQPALIPCPRSLCNMDILHPNKDETNNLIMFSLPCGKYTPNNAAQYLILSTLLEQPVYNFLRTKHQLGYLVKSLLTYDNLNYSIIIKVQSTLKVKIIEEKMHIFIEWFTKYLKKLDIKKFDSIKESVCGLLLADPSNMGELIQKYIGEIKNRTYIFTRNELIANEIKLVSFDTIKQLYALLIQQLVVIKLIIDPSQDQD